MGLDHSDVESLANFAEHTHTLEALDLSMDEDSEAGLWDVKIQHVSL